MSTVLTITVTKEILERSKNCGILNDGTLLSENCAISLAIRDIFPCAKIGDLDIFPFSIDVDHAIPLPDIAKSFIWSFDHAAPEARVLMQPLSFDIELPDWVIEKIDISELKPLLENHSTLKLQTA